MRQTDEVKKIAEMRELEKVISQATKICDKASYEEQETVSAWRVFFSCVHNTYVIAVSVIP